MNIEIRLNSINGKEVLAVTSLQVAEMFDKRHDHVMRDITEVISKCSESFCAPNFGDSSYRSEQNKELPMYLLSKDGFMMLTMGYTGEKAMALKEAYITRFNEMEAQLSNRLLDVPNFSNPAMAARAWADQYERRQIAEAQRDEAIRTKAWISDKKTATAMNTASQLSKENGKLKDALGEGKTWKQAAAIEWLTQYFVLSRGFWSALGMKLSKLSDELGYEKRTVPSSKYGSVNLYHVDVIEKLRERLDAHPDMLWKYRKEAA